MNKPVLRPPAGGIEHAEIIQRSRTTDDVRDEGTTSESAYYPVGRLSGKFTISGTESGTRVEVQTTGRIAKAGHLLRYRDRIWEITEAIEAKDHTTIFADEIDGGPAAC